MLRALTANLVAHERIETTDAKAKELRRVAERLITHAVRLGPIAYTAQEQLSISDQARRQAVQQRMGRFLRRFGTVGDGANPRKLDLVEKVFIDLAKRFKDRPGGYTRIVKLGRRRGDNAPMSLIEFVDRADALAETPEPSKESKSKTAEPEAEAEAEAEAEPKPAPASKRAAKSKAVAESKAESEPAEKTRRPRKAAKKDAGETPSSPESATQDEGEPKQE
jgi:large subunit ribosomal protein L17